jgi:thiamine biosynthesis protein ThiS
MVRISDREIPWHEDMTVADLIKELGDHYPYTVARVNNKTIPGHEFSRARVPDNSEVFLIPLIAGG